MRINVHHDLPDLPSIRNGNGGALNGSQLRADEVHSQIIQLLLGHAFAAQSELQDGNRGRVITEDQGRRDSGRKLLQADLSLGDDFRNRSVNIGGRLQKHFDHRNSVQGLRLDMLDVIDAGGERSLEDRDDTCFHLGRHQAGIGPDDADDRNVDAREDIDRRTEQNDRADQKQHQREHDERIRARESEFYDPHKEPPSSHHSNVAARISRSESVHLKSSSNLRLAPGTARLAILLASASAASSVANVAIFCPLRISLCPDRSDSIRKL